MKTVHQRLQSRISRRRNFIRMQEEMLGALKRRRHACKQMSAKLGMQFDLDGLHEEIDTLRERLNLLADDQRLDKKLKNIVRTAEYFGFRV